MKRLLFILMLFSLCIDLTVKACTCMPVMGETYEKRLEKYSFVAVVRVISVRFYDYTAFNTTNDKHEDFAKIEIIELFKGQAVDSVFIGGIGTSCDLGMRPNTTWLIYGSSNNTSRYVATGFCSGSRNLNAFWIPGERPFYTDAVYQLRQYFNHPEPLLQNDGIHTQYRAEGILKTRYTVLNGKLENSFYLNDGDTTIYYTEFSKGKFHGVSYYLNTASKYASTSNYENGVLNEEMSFRYTDNGLHCDLTTRENIATLLSSPRKIFSHRQVLPDKSVMSKSWHEGDWLSYLYHKDSTGRLIYTAEYNGPEKKPFRESKYNADTGETTSLLYNSSNGTIRRKTVTYPDKRSITWEYNPDGSVKETKTVK